MTKKIHDLISLENTTSLVTGGSGHLGAAISETLAELGSNVIVVGRNLEKGTSFVEHLKNKFNISSSFFQVDLNSKDSIELFTQKLDEPINILVNNAFTWPSTFNIENTTWDDFGNTLTSGITSPFYITKLITKSMKNNGGSIINIASMYGMVSPNFKIYHEQPKMGNALSYNAAKSAIIQMSKYMAVYYAKWNIRVNSISPGPFPRPGTFSNGKEWFEEELKGMNPLHMLGEPWHLKGGVALLASSLGSYITGQNISIDGGWTTW
jgi:NAD(P)-dependent dehydrogenase (short-subunit alcohol dehydrogenase family)